MKRIIAITLISVALVLTISACNHSDADENDPIDSRIGYGVEFGGLLWRIIDVREDRVLLISADVLSTRAYHSENTETTWEECDLRAYLNGEFYGNTFSTEEQEDIIETSVTNDDNSRFGTTGGNATTDKVFLLSMDEVEKYPLPPVTATNYGDEVLWWWLRTPGEEGNRATCLHTFAGILDMGGLFVDETHGVRPVFWLRINLDEVFDSSVTT